MLYSPLPIRVFKNKIYHLHDSYDNYNKAKETACKLRKEIDITNVKVLKTHDKKFQYSVYVNMFNFGEFLIFAVAGKKKLLQSKKVGY